MKTIRRLSLSLFLAAVASTPAFAQQPPAAARGFDPDKVFAAGPIDSVNAFNGNVIATIPLGQTYTVSPTLSYSFKAIHNGKTWDYIRRHIEITVPCMPPQSTGDEPCTTIWTDMQAIPDGTANAGFGWRVQFARFILPGDLQSHVGRTLLETPDGAHHGMYVTLHDGDPQDGANYTRDATYLRWRETGVAGRTAVDTPEGVTYEFTDYKLTQMHDQVKDASGNYVNRVDIQYGPAAGDPAWPCTDQAISQKFTDTKNRTSYVCFENMNYDGTSRPTVTDVYVGTPAGTAHYAFAHAQTVFARENYDKGFQYLYLPATVTVPALMSITRPDGSSYDFQYFGTIAHPGIATGNFQSITLPTKGSYEYDYGYYLIPMSYDCPTDEEWLASSNPGVEKREERDAGGTVVGRTTYGTNGSSGGIDGGYYQCTTEQEGPGYFTALAPGAELSNFVIPGDNRSKTVHYYSVWPGYNRLMVDSPDGFKRVEYGLPFTRNASKMRDGLFLSTETYLCTDAANAQCSASPIRATYVQYEVDARIDQMDIATLDHNPRLKKAATVYFDDVDPDTGAATTTTSTISNDDFDGLGHYRVSETAGFGGTTTRRTTTNFNPNAGTFPGTHTLPSTTSPWLLNLFTYQETKEIDTAGDVLSSAKTEVCFDNSNGFLERRRIVAGGAIAPTRDLLAVFEPNGNGEVAAESYYGGDLVPLPSAFDTCTSSISAPQYRITHNYASGVLTRSQYDGTTFNSYDVDVHPSTSAISTSRDTAGVPTTYVYDPLGRLTEIHLTGQAAASYEYDLSATPAKVTVRQCQAGTATCPETSLSETRYYYDGLGRIVQEARRMPDAVWSVIWTTYDILGRRRSRSVAVSRSDGEFLHPMPAGTAVTQWDYDYAGRVSRETRPDDTFTRFEYFGAREIRRYAGKNTTEHWKSTERYDSFGRLIEVSQPAGPTTADQPTGANVSTTYAYDTADRLVRVTTGSQERTFQYDGRGFLVREEHPESGVTTYDEYDARGHNRERSSGGRTLAFELDDAERLRKVLDGTATDAATVKEFTYGSDNVQTTEGTDRRKGKLITAVRHNELPQVGTVAVTESYEYLAPGGQMSKRKTRVDIEGQAQPVQEYEYTVAYDPFALPRTVTMPCNPVYGCAGIPAGATTAVEYDREQGLLTGVTGLAGLSYHPSGMVASVEHAGTPGATDLYEDSSRMGRPSRITLAKSCRTPAPVIVASEFVCPSASAVASVDEEPGATYSWTITGGTLETSASLPNVTFHPDGSSPVTLQVTVTSGCGGGSGTVSKEIQVVTSPLPPVISAPSAFCTAGVALQASVPATPGMAYSWTIDGGKFIDDTNSAIGPVVTFAPTGDSSVTLTVTAANGCGATAVDTAIISRDPSCATLRPCAIEVVKGLPPWTFTVLPNETTPIEIAAELKEGSGIKPALAWSIKWYHDDLLEPSALDPQTTLSATWTHVLHFEDQVRLRAEIQLACSYTTPQLTLEAKHVEETYGVRYGHCPVPDVMSGPTTVDLVNGSAELSAASKYPDAQYQWYAFESGNTRTPLSGRTAPSLTVNSAGTYWLRVSAPCGAHTDTETFVVRVPSCSPVRIQADPSPSTIAAGGDVTLTMSASGTPAPYQFLWFRDSDTEHDEPIADSAGLQTIIVRNIQKTTDFSARATNACSSSRTRFARVHVTSCADIPVTEQPVDVRLGGTGSVTLSIGATAQRPLKYQWYAGESGDTTTPLAGQTSPTLLLDRQAALSDHYWVRVSFEDGNGCAVDSRTVNVCRDPVVQNPIGNFVNVIPDQRRDLNVVANGSNLSYAWYEGSEASADLSRPMQSTSDTMRVWPAITTYYWVGISAGCDVLESGVVFERARVSVPPKILSTTVNGIEYVPGDTDESGWITLGSSPLLSVSANGIDLSYQWYRRVGTSEVAIDGATASTCDTGPLSADATFFCRVKSGDAPIDTADIALKVCNAPVISTTGYQTQVSGAVVGLHVYDVDDPENKASTYTWYRGASGDTSQFAGSGSGIVVQPRETTDYWVQLTRPGCSANSAALRITICYPAVDSQPQNASIVKGQQAVLTAHATGTPPLSYQWFKGSKGDTTTPVGTGESYTTPTTLASTSSYWTRISSPQSCASNYYTDSEAATVTVCLPAEITSHPANTIITSMGALLSVQAIGTDLTYQWYRGARGDTSAPQASQQSAISVNPTATTDYWVRVTASCGAPADSLAATVYVRPSITSQPAGGLVTKGTTRLLSVGASGTRLAYQWFSRSGGTTNLLSGATGSTYTTAAIQTDSTYFCRVSSGIPEVYTDSADAILTVCQPREIRIVGYPSRCSGSDVTMSVVDPDPNETYQWYEGLSGDTSMFHGTGTAMTARPLATTRYWVRTKRPSCDADSPALEVVVCYPDITAQPEGGTIPQGDSWFLNVSATGTAPLTYQWYEGAAGDTTKPVGNQQTYATPTSLPVTTTYWVRVSSPLAGCTSSHVDSQTATVHVCQPPVISQQPQSNNYPKGTALTLSVTASGDGPLHYQWYKGVSGTTTQPIGSDQPTINLYANATESYWVRVTGSCGVINSATALVSVFPVITQQPVNTTVCGYGSTATFSVVATGASTYSWFRKVGSTLTPVGNGTSSLQIAIATSPETYLVKVASGNAVNQSNPATATVNVPPTVDNFTAPSYDATRYKLTVAGPSGQSGLVGYQFYTGTIGDTSNLLRDWSQPYFIVTPPTKPMNYWVRVYWLATPSVCPTDRGVTIQ